MHFEEPIEEEDPTHTRNDTNKFGSCNSIPDEHKNKERKERRVSKLNNETPQFIHKGR